MYQLQYKRIDLETIDFSHAKPMVEKGLVTVQTPVIGEEILSVSRNVDHEGVRVSRMSGERIVTAATGEHDLIRSGQFNLRYKPSKTEGYYEPRGVVVAVVPVNENIEFLSPGGDLMKVRNGGGIAKINDNEVYPIRPEEMNDRYIDATPPSPGAAPGSTPGMKP